MYYLALHIYTIYTSCLHGQYIHTRIYRHLSLHHNNYSFKSEMNNSFPEALKSVNVLDIVDKINSNTIILKIIIIIYRCSNIKVNTILIAEDIGRMIHFPLSNYAQHL